MSLLALDSRWRRFNDESRQCPCCGQSFSGIYDLGFDAPDDWPHGPSEGEDREYGQDRLSPELCRYQGRYFIRCGLALPVRGADDAMVFGAWAEVAPDLARSYAATLDGGAFAGGEGILANALPGFEDAEGTAVTLLPTQDIERPALTAEDGALAEAQTQGISFDDLLDVYAAAGNDIRPHLAND